MAGLGDGGTVSEAITNILTLMGGSGVVAKIGIVILVAKKLGWRALWSRLKELVGGELEAQRRNLLSPDGGREKKKV